MARAFRTIAWAVLFAALASTNAAAATQEIRNGTSDGSLRVRVLDSGKMAVYRYDASQAGLSNGWRLDNGWVSQVYGPTSKNSYLFLAGDNTAMRFSTGDVGTSWTGVSNETVGGDIVTVFDIPGTSVRVTQTVALSSGPYYRIQWEIRNTGATAFNDVRFAHGEDTYFGGSDSGEGHYDNTLKMVYVTNTAGGTTGLMGFYASASTPFARYYEAGFSENYNAMRAFTLDNTVNPNNVDCGYSLGWTRSSLGAGQAWSIIAYEKFTSAGAEQVIAPAEETGAGGGTVTFPFTVRNLDAASATFDLSAVSEHGWPTSVRNGSGAVISSVTIAGGDEANVFVRVAIPAGTDNGTTDLLTLTASASGLGSSSDSTTTVVSGSAPAPAPSSHSFDFSQEGVGAGWCGTVFRIGGGGGSGPLGGAAALTLYFALFLLPVAIARRLHRVRKAPSPAAPVVLLAVLGLLCSSVAFAGGLVPKAQRFRPTMDGYGAVTVDSDETLPAGKSSQNIFLNVVKRPLSEGTNQDLHIQGEIVDELATLDLAFAYGLGPRLEIGADLPVNFLIKGRTPPESGTSSNLSLGDIRVSGKWRAVAGKTYGLALIPYYNFATGDRDRYLSEGKNALGGKIAGHLDLTNRLSLVANAGAEKPGSLTASKSSPDRYNTWFQYGAGLVCRIDAASALTAEINGETTWSHAFDDQRVSPVELLAGYRKLVAPNVVFNVGGGGGLNKGMGAPQYRAFLGLSYVK